MSDCTQMTLIEITPSAGSATGGGLSSAGCGRSSEIASHGGLAELSEPESSLLHALVPPNCDPDTSGLIDLIRLGQDPLGDAFMRLRPPDQRRPLGATYTPPRSCPRWSPGWLGALDLLV